jgi:Kef-type K+ transport system membrane component KefB/nucleotide-binding universal stress UspA family protein
MRFEALSEEQQLVFWVQLLVLVVVARGLGAVARRVGQPAVIGELAAGVVLGPSVLGRLAPPVWDWLFPNDPVAAGIMAAVGWIGVFLLLVLAGYETDLGLVRRLGRAAALVSAGSLLVPLAFGAAVGVSMPARFVGPAGDAGGFALFMATALSISSLPVVAKVLSDLDLVRRNFGQLTLAAGMANDVVGWVLLGLLASIASEGALDWGRLGLAVGGLVVLLPASITVGQRAVDAALRAVRQQRGGVGAGLTVTLLVALVGAAVAQAIGLEGVLGAFVAGVVLGRSKFQDTEVFATLEHVTVALFAPVFFARAGLQVDLGVLRDPVVVLWAAIVVAAASGSKLLGAWLGARAARLPAGEGLALGAGLNARGALEIVVATVGLGMGVLNGASYTLVVLMAIATSMLAPLMLRAVARRWEGTPEERARLERERVLGRNLLVRPARVLLPSSGGPNSRLAAAVLDLLWPEDVEVTVLSVGADAAPPDLTAVVQAFSRRPVERVHVASRDTLAAVLEQARLGYGAIAVGATDRTQAGVVVSPLVDELLASSPLPVLVVRRGTRDAPFCPRRVLVPAVGTPAGRAAQEVGYALAQACDGEVLLAHVVTVPRQGIGAGLWPWRRRPATDDERTAVAARVVEEARALAAEAGARARTEIRTGVSVAEEMLALASELAPDAIVVTANVRQLSGRPFLGHGVEHFLEHSDATLIVVATPPGWQAAAERAPQPSGSAQASPAA